MKRVAKKTALDIYQGIVNAWNILNHGPARRLLIVLALLAYLALLWLLVNMTGFPWYRILAYLLTGAAIYLLTTELFTRD